MVFAGSFSLTRDNFDPDAQTYIDAVEAADTEPLEAEVRRAIVRFVKGCKHDGIWDAIKASCILAGARTLTSALVPLVGTAPTNFNFVSGDYNRKTGLKGNGSNKYLNSNRANNADPQNNNHLSIYKTDTISSTNSYFIGAAGGGILSLLERKVCITTKQQGMSSIRVRQLDCMVFPGLHQLLFLTKGQGLVFGVPLSPVRPLTIQVFLCLAITLVAWFHQRPHACLSTPLVKLLT